MAGVLPRECTPRAEGAVKLTVRPGGSVRGEAGVPGDKSITHRALLLGAVADGDTVVRGYLDSGDCQASVEAARALGAEVSLLDHDTAQVRGLGLGGLREPEDVLNCRGSGTTMRLAAGLLAGQPFTSVFTGNAALRSRPMARIIDPLRRMGARVLGRAGDRLPPLTIRGGGLTGIEYDMPVASAQVKSGILLAGLYAAGATTVLEPRPTRDHTERMLAAMGGTVSTTEGRVRVQPARRLHCLDIRVPGDLSSAAFLIGAATLAPDSEVMVRGVGVNPTRTGFLDILAAMGGRVVLENQREEGGEPVADIVVRSADLGSTLVSGDLIPLAIDELPLVAVLATQAAGVTEVRDASELRVKESDRVATVVAELTRMGARITGREDGYIVEGPTRLHGVEVDSHGDHRLAMCLAVAALVADGPVTIRGAECAADSFPGFFELLDSLRR